VTDFHGWRVGDKSIHVGGLPGRKQTCLYVQDGSTIRTLAFFATEEKAVEALEMLDRLAKVPA
jgi:H2-forming N5,N10-methylenetetrahydromethanopterin dehydrogenase-like enzyme